ncbi:MAG TPA: hypothetical protein DEB39_12165 [Planctomycetaceae bacterium]|nr:hypothetical protein [Planctomycetaceae bacterium]
MGFGIDVSTSRFVNFSTLIRSSSFAAWFKTSSQSSPCLAHSMARLDVLASIRVAAAFASFMGSTCSRPSQNQQQLAVAPQ